MAMNEDNAVIIKNHETFSWKLSPVRLKTESNRNIKIPEKKPFNEKYFEKIYGNKIGVTTIPEIAHSIKSGINSVFIPGNPQPDPHCPYQINIIKNC